MKLERLNDDLVQQLIEREQQVRENPYRFAIYENAPMAFCKDVLGVSLWYKQEEVLKATLSHRYIAVRSGHSVGKTFAVACLVIWWLYARQGVVVTTAPTWEHVEGVLWKEIHRLVDGATVHLPRVTDRPLLTELRITNTWNAIGLSTNKPSAFQGRHHPRLLGVVDEAAGVEEQVHLELSTCATGDENCIAMIGNPTSTSGTFFNAFKPGSGWHRIQISCFDHPNVVHDREIIKGAVTKGWVERKRRQWGEHHPLWYSRVLGEFPKISERGCIPPMWVERQANEEGRKKALEEAEKGLFPRIGGLDVARYGDNKCVLTIRHGDAVKEIIDWHHTSLMETAGRAMRAIEDKNLTLLVVDASGIGAGVYDRMLEQNAPVMAYNGGHRAFTPSTYNNRRTEMWWHLRQRFEKGRIWIPADAEILQGDLIAPEYTVASSGRLQLETKENMLDRGVPSPDFADSLVLCFAADEDPEATLLEEPSPQQDPDAFAALHPMVEMAPFGQLPEGF